MIESTRTQTKHNSDPQDSFSRALRAAAAVTGKGRRALSASAPAVGVVLASMLGACADSAYVETPSGWALSEPAAPRADAGGDAGVDMSSTPDLLVTAACEQESLAERWRCCVDADFMGAGCEVCAHHIVSAPEQGACMACGEVMAVAQEWSNYELCCAQSVRQHVTNPSDQVLFEACTPWGPPAPPLMGARKLLELIVA